MLLSIAVRDRAALHADSGALVTRLDSSECRFRDVSEAISSFCGTQTYLGFLLLELIVTNRPASGCSRFGPSACREGGSVSGGSSRGA